MNHLLKKLLEPRQIEYLILNENLVIVETSLAVQRFADCADAAVPGKDVRLGFPEFIGVEKILQAILKKQRASFEVKGIGRFLDSSFPLYIDLYVSNFPDETPENRLLILFEDATEKMVIKQSLLQRANEANLLLSALAASKDYIEKILSSMTDALLVTTPSGRIKTTNRAAQLLLGYSESELINQPLSSFVPNVELVDPPLVDQGEFLREGEIVCLTKTGAEIVVEFSCSPIQDIEGLYDLVYIGRDITNRKREETEIRFALAKEKETQELKSRFFSMVSHEFGSPINTVLFSAALLKQYGHRITEEEKRQYIHHIQVAARHMIELLNDLRLVGSAEAGKLEFHPAPLDLEKFCLDLVEEIQLGAGSKHHLEFTQSKHQSFINEEDAEHNLPQLDAKLLRHILTNLLINGIKYSPEQTTVYFDFISDVEKVIFQIRDEGIGIPPEEQKKLFEAFYRASNVEQIPGTGLGLAIVKQCVQVQGGTIEVASEVGAGTTFKVTIPLQSTPDAL